MLASRNGNCALTSGWASSTGVTYWEGACRVEGTRGGRPIAGRAYVEMTGYAGRDVPGALLP